MNCSNTCGYSELCTWTVGCTHLTLASTGLHVSRDLVDGALDLSVLADLSKIAPSLVKKMTRNDKDEIFHC